MDFKIVEMSGEESMPGTSPVPEAVKLAIAGFSYRKDIKELNLERKTSFCHIIVDRLYTDAIFLPEKIPSLW